MAHSVYLTYEEYQKYGGTVDQTSFPLLELACRKRIDYLTASRIQGMKEVPDAVKLCMVSLINVESAVGIESQANRPQVTSFTTDGYSESYGKALSTAEASAGQVDMIRTALYGEVDDEGVPLLYRGLC